MNLPNKLSLTRAALVPVMVALMIPFNGTCLWLAAVVFAVASFTDYLDGHIARKNNLVTDFGKFIDPLADKLLTLSALIMLCRHGLMAGWVVCVILARELSVDGLRMMAVTHGKVMAAGKLGKIKTVSQIALILWQMILRTPLLTDPFWKGLPGCILTGWVVIITLWSGADYFIKNGRFLLDDM